MIILLESTHSSLLKAAMLSKMHRGLCLHRDELAGKLIDDEIIDCSRHSLDDIIKKYESCFGPVTWLNSKKARDIAGAVFYASRYKQAPNNSHLIVTVLLQALERGPDYVLSRVSGEAREMFNRSRRVCMEIHRAYGFVRLSPAESWDSKILIGRVGFEHHIHGFVLRYFSKRHHNHQIYLIDGDQAFYLKNRAVNTCPVADLPFSIKNDDFTAVWEAYYDSQFIESRKNLALAKKHVPKKYWSWVPEGNKFK